MSDYTVSRRRFLTAAGATAAGTAAGCLDSDHDTYDISDIKDDGLEVLDGEQIELTGYTELQDNEPAYLRREREDGTVDMIEPVGIYHLYDTPEPEESEYGIPIIHNHAEYHLGSDRDSREYRVRGTVGTYFRDEAGEDEVYGLYLEEAHTT